MDSNKRIDTEHWTLNATIAVDDKSIKLDLFLNSD